MFATYNLLDNVNEMRSLIDNFFDDRFYTRTVEYPYVNLYEKDDTIEIAALAPGQKVENINLQLIDNKLILAAEKKNDYEDKSYIRKERDFGTFRKTLELPYRVDQNKIEASLKEGILTIKLVKAEEAKPKKIEIH